MKVEWKKLMFGLAIGAGMMMMASCSDEENFDPGGSPGKEVPEPTEKAFLSMRLSTGSLAGTGWQSTRQPRDVQKNRW